MNEYLIEYDTITIIDYVIVTAKTKALALEKMENLVKDCLEVISIEKFTELHPEYEYFKHTKRI